MGRYLQRLAQRSGLAIAGTAETGPTVATPAGGAQLAGDGPAGPAARDAGPTGPVEWRREVIIPGTGLHQVEPPSTPDAEGEGAQFQAVADIAQSASGRSSTSKAKAEPGPSEWGRLGARQRVVDRLLHRSGEGQGDAAIDSGERDVGRLTSPGSRQRARVGDAPVDSERRLIDAPAPAAAAESPDQSADPRSTNSSDALLDQAIRWVMEDPHWTASSESASGADEAATPNPRDKPAAADRPAGEGSGFGPAPSADRPPLASARRIRPELEQVAVAESATRAVPTATPALADGLFEQLAGSVAPATARTSDPAIPWTSTAEPETPVQIHIGRISIEIREPEPASPPAPAAQPSLPAGRGSSSSDRRLRRLYLRGF